ncbi:hypothetical protein [Haloferax marisrubri]|uniref:hypothetical protein n=1 Tax=Haloferax marisrubri TaxID=1544719 RepID=UPI0018ED938D|nr:hypothetical protein [Haloferax marisrubri]
MTETDAPYPVNEAIGNPAHSSFEDVWCLMRARGHSSHANQQDAHFDEMMTDVLARYDEGTIRAVAHRILVELSPFRTATIDLDVETVDGVRVGTIAVGTLRELHDSTDTAASTCSLPKLVQLDSA